MKRKQTSTKQRLRPVPAITKQPRQKNKKSRQSIQQLSWNPFLSSHQDLTVLIGEADFSFAKCIHAQNYCYQLVASSLDSRDALKEKHPGLQATINDLTQSLAQIMHGLDATAVASHKELQRALTDWKDEWPDGTLTFVFNFPHLGNSEPDQQRNIYQHQQLLVGFFKELNKLRSRFGPNLRALITLFEGEPYDSWGLKQLAKQEGLTLLRSGAFVWSMFPEYVHCLTRKDGSTSKPQKSRKARTYMFSLGSVNDSK